MKKKKEEKRQEEKKQEKRFTKEQFISIMKEKADLLQVLLKEEELYSKEEVETFIQSFQKGQVRS